MSAPAKRSDIDYDAFKAQEPNLSVEPTTQQINDWVQDEEAESLDDPEDRYGNNYTPGLGWDCRNLPRCGIF